jgi:hypothetical protein
MTMRERRYQAHIEEMAGATDSNPPFSVFYGALGRVNCAFFNSILPAVRGLKFLRHYTGDGGWVAGQAEISLANSKTLYVLDAFHIENGEIIEQQSHYDPRPATG